LTLTLSFSEKSANLLGICLRELSHIWLISSSPEVPHCPCSNSCSFVVS
jgi:hypothetical protein